MPETATKPATKTETPQKRTKQRSPAYPFIGLKTAIERAKEFYKHDTRNAASVPVAVKHWGYKEKSSGGIQTIAALISFGLLQDSGSGEDRKVQLSDIGLRIVMDERTQSSERDKLIKQAALTPKIHAILWNRFKTDLPSDENLRYELRITYKFNDNAVGDFIQEYRDTISFAKLSGSDSISPPSLETEGVDGSEEEQTMQEQQLTETKVHHKLPTGARPVGASIPVTKNCSISILAVGDVTQKGLDQLINYIRLIRESFPKDEPEASN
jgi:hypothetical protein